MQNGNSYYIFGFVLGVRNLSENQLCWYVYVRWEARFSSENGAWQLLLPYRVRRIAHESHRIWFMK